MNQAVQSAKDGGDTRVVVMKERRVTSKELASLELEKNKANKVGKCTVVERRQF